MTLSHNLAIVGLFPGTPSASLTQRDQSLHRSCSFTMRVPKLELGNQLVLKASNNFGKGYTAQTQIINLLTGSPIQIL